MDFKSQVLKDMEVFHNLAEMAEITDIYYNGKQYTVPLILDHAEAASRGKSEDHAQGIVKIDAVAYIALTDIGVVPKQGREIEIGTEKTGYTAYQIKKSGCEEGEIILELEEYEE